MCSRPDLVQTTCLPGTIHRRELSCVCLIVDYAVIITHLLWGIPWRLFWPFCEQKLVLNFLHHDFFVIFELIADSKMVHVVLVKWLKMIDESIVNLSTLYPVLLTIFSNYPHCVKLMMLILDSFWQTLLYLLFLIWQNRVFSLNFWWGGTQFFFVPFGPRRGRS